MNENCIADRFMQFNFLFNQNCYTGPQQEITVSLSLISSIGRAEASVKIKLVFTSTFRKNSENKHKIDFAKNYFPQIFSFFIKSQN